ncbi:hypothetical protein HK097_006899 [Rhizophlyctis rosea]|uniref:Uncharacterized protein n=1 Tax=Rhizophlyctis rosea TaxID=64517 RepID=A0AAD5SK75_9FUNG|nr:hypothetical protein HK097_006899 [Rhizophlyctis rosea]
MARDESSENAPLLPSTQRPRRASNIDTLATQTLLAPFIRNLHSDDTSDDGGDRAADSNGAVTPSSVVAAAASSVNGGRSASSYGSAGSLQRGKHKERDALSRGNSFACPDKGHEMNDDAARDRRKLIIATTLCFAFFILELVAGIVAGSLAILSDSFHLLSDIAGFAISLVALYLTQQPATKRHSYGFYRAEIIGAILSVFLIWILTAFLLLEAVERVRNPTAIDGRIMAGTAAIGRKHQNINITSAAIHVIGDLLSSIGVLIAAIVIWVRPDLTIVDPICTFVFSVFVLATTIRLMYNSVTVLMEATPSDIDPHAVDADLREITGVRDVHDLHIWNLTIGKPSLSVHITIHRLDPHTSAELLVSDYHRILASAQELVCSKYGIHHATVQLEGEGFVDDHDSGSEGSVGGGHCSPAMCRTG